MAASTAGSEAAPASDPEPTGKRLTVRQARRYMVELVNRDRAREGLRPVLLDEGPPTASGQRHAEDMALNGYLGHWGTDGSVPEQRLTEAGGADMVLENALCFTDEKHRKLDPSPTIDRAQIEKAEAMFFNEVPPNDGHRKNILKAFHTNVGIGIAQPVATETEIPVPCFSQEFTDEYGAYEKVPASARLGQTITVDGSLTSAATVAGVGLARTDAPRSLGVGELNTRRNYPVPQPYQMYWPAGFVTPIPLRVKGHTFHIAVPLGDHGKPGLYELSVWGKLPDAKELVIVGLRTIRVE